MRPWLPCILVLCCSGCGAETGQEPVSIPLHVAGSGGTSIVLDNDVELQVLRADLAFGPLYLCSGPEAGDFCETARAEWLDSVVIDLLDSSPARVGRIRGSTGTVRSWMYDLGISSLLTETSPTALDAAQALGNASLLVEALAERDGAELSLTLRVVVDQAPEGEWGVPVVRRSRSDEFDHEIRADEQGLLVRFDAAPWFRGLDLAPYFEELDCGDDAPCRGELVIDAPGPLYNHLRLALEAGARPVFDWGFSP